MRKKITAKLKSWTGIREACDKIGGKIINSGYKPDIIIAVARGGLVPAMNLSDILGIKDLVSIQVEHWGKTAEKDAKAKLKYNIDIFLPGRKVLIADDISDTGESFEVACEFIKNLNPDEIKTAAIHYVKTSRFKPDFYAETVDRTDEFIWIVYPWNIIEDTINLIEKLGISYSDTNKIKRELKENYGFVVDGKTLEKITAEMRRRY